MDVDENGDRSDADDHSPRAPARRSLATWLRNTNTDPGIVAAIRRARRILPGDPEFGDPLSMTGDGGPQAAARAADRMLREREAATREVGLATLQVWQALAEKVSRRPADADVSIVFTDLVGFSNWSLQAGDDATLRLLRQVAQAAEPPLLDAGGHIVKRMGDGMMAVFTDAFTAVRSTIEAIEAVKTVEVEGYTPQLRAGVHTGRPQRIGGDWLGVDVNIAARVMERAAKGGLVVSERTLQEIAPEKLESMGVTVKRARRQVFGPRQAGVPADLTMYRLTCRGLPDGDGDG